MPIPVEDEPELARRLATLSRLRLGGYSAMFGPTSEEHYALWYRLNHSVRADKKSNYAQHYNTVDEAVLYWGQLWKWLPDPEEEAADETS